MARESSRGSADRAVTGNGNGHWKAAAMFLAGLVVAMASFYVAEFRRTLTRDEAVQLIEQMRPSPPWVQDRANVLQRLDDYRDRIGTLEQRPSSTVTVEPWMRNQYKDLRDRVEALERWRMSGK